MQVTLVSMPWAIYNRPSIQLGALKGYLGEQIPECTVKCVHPYLDAAAEIGLAAYRSISGNPWAGEALYSGLLFPDQRDRARLLFCRELPQYGPRFEQLCRQLDYRFSRLFTTLDLSDCRLLGLSVCFSQLLGSLYAAGRIKTLYPELPIVFGGSTCTHALAEGLLRNFPQVDYVLLGEGEQPLADLVRHLLFQDPLPNSNILSRNNIDHHIRKPENCERPSLDALPVPDYDDYFQELRAARLPFSTEIPFEFSRGCWWNKCSFCNLNLQWCGYRFKHHEKMLRELELLTRRHQSLDFFFTDNALPPAEARRFFQKTAALNTDHRFFAEIRVPKSARECACFSRGGLVTVQTGIEALSDSLLERMNKGTTAMENIAAMKYALAAGIRLEGNLIIEFPGSTPEEVNETLRALDAVTGYPPLQAARFFLGQGSPVCDEPRRYGILAVTPHPNNRLLFPEEQLNDLDLLIKGYRGDRTRQRKLWQPVRKKIKAWQQFHNQRSNPHRPALSMRDGGNFLLLRQETPDGQTLRHRLKGISREIYLACEEPISKKKLLQRFNTIKKEQLDNFLNGLAAKQLLYSTTTHCLALAVPDIP